MPAERETLHPFIDGMRRHGRHDLAELTAEVCDCRRCGRLVDWREGVARERRAAYRDQTYWGRPVPGFGDPEATVMVVGLAPAAHGANRTGRLFTGDRSGDWLFRSMHRAGLASQATSTDLDDGLELIGAWVTAVVKCAPPDNRPSTDERDSCIAFLDREVSGLTNLRVVVALGAFAYEAVCRQHGIRPRPRFTHGVEAVADRDRLVVIGSYHPSQQNTFTGRLTEAMLDEVFERAVERARSTGRLGQ